MIGTRLVLLVDIFLPLQVWIGIPIFMVLVSAYLVIAPIYEAPLQSFLCLLFISTGIPFYLVFVRYKKAPVKLLRFVGKFMHQLMPVSVIYQCSRIFGIHLLFVCSRHLSEVGGIPHPQSFGCCCCCCCCCCCYCCCRCCCCFLLPHPTFFCIIENF